MRRLAISMLALAVLASAGLMLPALRTQIRALVRHDPPPRITPLAVAVDMQAPISRSSPTATASVMPSPSVSRSRIASAAPASLPTEVALSVATPSILPTSEPTPTILPSPRPVEHNGRVYDAYIPAAAKPKQFFQYSCEFDAAWVILTTYGFDVDGDDLVSSIEHDRSIEPAIKETSEGFLIYGGDITRAYSGDYTKNFLARTTGQAMRGVFERYGLHTAMVRDRAGVEQALRSGDLVWMKTTVDFNQWRSATWIMPDGRTYQTVLGNDHAVVAMGFSDRGVVIRDVLGPTSTNRERPYEYEVDWETFLAAWGAQSFDGVAVAAPAGE